MKKKKQLFPNCCEEQDTLYYNRMRAKEFIPWKVGYWQEQINLHERECPKCRKLTPSRL